MNEKQRWKSYLCLEILERNEQIYTVKFQNFLGGAMPPDPTPSALRASLGLRPFHCPSLCVIDILRYFSGPGVSGNRNLPVTSPILDH